MGRNAPGRRNGVSPPQLARPFRFIGCVPTGRFTVLSLFDFNFRDSVILTKFIFWVASGRFSVFAGRCSPAAPTKPRFLAVGADIFPISLHFLMYFSLLQILISFEPENIKSQRC